MEEIIQNIFSLSKLRNDFFKWLDENYPDHNKIEIYEIYDSDKVKLISLSKKDILHMYKLNIEYDRYQGLWYYVNLAIGNFVRPNESGFMKIEKAIVRLSYNADLSLSDVELFFDELHDGK